MPKDTTKSISTRSKGKQAARAPVDAPSAPPCVVFTYETRRVALPKSILEKSYTESLRLIRQTFDLSDLTQIVLQTSELPECDDGEEVEIPSVTWTVVLSFISKITVALRILPMERAHATHNSLSLAPSHNPLPLASKPYPLPTSSLEHERASSSTGSASDSVRIRLSWELRSKDVRIRRAANLVKCLDRAMQYSSHACADAPYTYVFYGSRISCRDTAEKLGMQDGALIDVFPQQVGGKPVIYLFPPTGQQEMDVSVNLSLVPQWKFSAIYPVVLIQPKPSKYGISELERVTWDVRTHQDGTMTEKTTGLNVSYLYWEAVTQGLPPSPPDSPLHEQYTERFDPVSSDISDDDAVSVVLPLAKATPYLDAALKVLGLHTEARTSFITYWLPSFNKHTHIALRFVSQDAYERAAPLNVVPKPDAIIRVFMLFKGVPESDLDLWPNATARVADPEGAERWREVIGLGSEDKLRDDSLFRVLEWGGMEVKR